MRKLIIIALVLCLCSACGIGRSTLVYEETADAQNSFVVHEGILVDTIQRIKYRSVNGQKTIITLSEPVVVYQADEPAEWGPYQFPSIGKASDGTLIVGWNMSQDSHKSYGNPNGRKITPMMSKDNGRTWVPRDKDYHELRGVNKVRLQNGKILTIVTPASKDITAYKEFPKAVGKRGNMSFYQMDKLPDEFQGVYISNGGQSIHAKLNDPGALRYAIDNLMPVQWWGIIKEVKDGTLIGGTYPNYYLDEDGNVAPSQVCFYQSNDGGSEWTVIGKVPFNPTFDVKDNDIVRNYGDYEEPAFEILADGTYICVMRTGMVTPMLKSFSYDNGRTWTIPEPFTPNGVDPRLLLLKNGVLVLASGRPGVQLRFSFDGKGESWSEPLDLIPFMHEDNSYETNVSCSYPALLEESTNSFYIVYTDFTINNDEGERRKTILFRRVRVK